MSDTPTVRITVPTHSETVTTVTMLTLLDFTRTAAARGWRSDVGFYSGALIGEIRNCMVRDFLMSDADVLLMIDSDQGCEADLLFRMIEGPFDVAGAIYPRRQYGWDKVKPETGLTADRMLLQASRFVGNLEWSSPGSLNVVNGFAKAQTLGAGLLMIRRQALEKMKERFPELKNKGAAPENLSGDPYCENWGFFNSMISSRSGYFLSEDYSFCQRWVEGCGGELWADVITPVTHVGRHNFHASFIDHLKASHPVQISSDRD